jgi:hypothetical protein
MLLQESKISRIWYELADVPAIVGNNLKQTENIAIRMEQVVTSDKVCLQ